MSQTPASTEEADIQLQSIAADVGMALAGRMFSGKHSSNVERHLSRAEIAAILAIAFEQGAKWQARRAAESST